MEVKLYNNISNIAAIDLLLTFLNTLSFYKSGALRNHNDIAQTYKTDIYSKRRRLQ